MVFKLGGDIFQEILKLKDVHLLDSIGGRPMKGWVQVPYEHHNKWKELALISTELVRKIKKESL